MLQCRQFVIICFLFGFSVSDNIEQKKFPPGFKIGAATSSYQIEGAAYEDGKGQSIWDTFSHKKPSPIKDGSTGDIAADSYHRYKEDVQLLKTTGFDHYRFSISWVRIQPRGEMDEISQEGINYYNKLINELLANNIEPVVTMYHWDLPQTLQDLGGWSNPLIANYFEDYAYILYKNFGDRVKRWITINEPYIIVLGYNTDLGAPGLAINGSGEYLAGHNIIRAHAKAYRLYEREFKTKQKGQVGITNLCDFVFPMDGTKESKNAAERALQFQCGWFSHPIFSKTGDYPQIMREVIDRNSVSEGRRRSRLPYFTPEEIKEIRGSFDFFGLNHYSSSIASVKTNYTSNETYYYRDKMVNSKPDPSWNASSAVPWFYVAPVGLRGILKWINENYDNPKVFITENGYGDSGRIDDYERINFFQGYLSEMLKAIHIDKCNVIGYTVWSLLDNFEWAVGYTAKFGITYVDFKGPEPVRTPKLSLSYFKHLLITRELPDTSRSFQKRNITRNGFVTRKN